MKKFILIIIGAALLIPSLTFAYSYYDYGTNQYANQYEQQYSNGNERLRLKTLADIERATQPTVEYDSYSDNYYICDWQYNQYLNTWMCKKDFNKAQPYLLPFREDRVCPYGYELDYTQQYCSEIVVPQSAHLNSSGDGWQCGTGYHLNYAKDGCDADMYIEPQYSYNAYSYQPTYQTNYYENKHTEKWHWHCVEWEYWSSNRRCVRWDGYMY